MKKNISRADATVLLPVFPVQGNEVAAGFAGGDVRFEAVYGRIWRGLSQNIGWLT
jgi:hypothetical protein